MAETAEEADILPYRKPPGSLWNALPRSTISGWMPIRDRHRLSQGGTDGESRLCSRAPFILPENCWTDHFYAPQIAVQEMFPAACGQPHGRDAVREQSREKLLYDKYKEYYGYVFYTEEDLTSFDGG